MATFNLNQKRFHPLSNSQLGTVNSNTIFDYTEYNGIVRATYHGGTILSGHILAQWQGDSCLKMLYHCLTIDQELKAGQATARLSRTKDGLIHMDLEWEWLGDNKGTGVSHYIEISRKADL